jgi:succinate dehydrogenase hydrophobic anchor subunit
MHRIVFFVFVFVWKQATMDAQEQQKELIRRNAELAKVLSLSLLHLVHFHMQTGVQVLFTQGYGIVEYGECLLSWVVLR